jgi:hypothetical protein
MSTDTLELIDLENLLDDDLPCEFQHVKTPCSEEVTHRIHACNVTANICFNAAKVQFERMAKAKLECDQCGRLVTECWRIVSI